MNASSSARRRDRGMRSIPNHISWSTTDAVTTSPAFLAKARSTARWGLGCERAVKTFVSSK
jgi:hypothetical protein